MLTFAPLTFLTTLGLATALSIPALHDERASYSNHATYTFGSGKLPAGLKVTSQTVGNHIFEVDNVSIKGGFLQLLVPGGQTVKPYSTAQVVTVVDNIKYASIRTQAILTPASGVCNGRYASLQSTCGLLLTPSRLLLLRQ